MYSQIKRRLKQSGLSFKSRLCEFFLFIFYSFYGTKHYLTHFYTRLWSKWVNFHFEYFWFVRWIISIWEQNNWYDGQTKKTIWNVFNSILHQMSGDGFEKQQFRIRHLIISRQNLSANSVCNERKITSAK